MVPGAHELGANWMKSRLSLSIALATSALCVTSPLFAQSDDQTAAARAAAEAGANAFDAGKWEKSISYFERAEALVHSPVHLWYIARSSVKVGRLVAAKEKCVKVQREGLPEGASRGVTAAYEGCNEVIREVEGRLASLTIELDGLPEDLTFEVLRNGSKVSSAIVGVPAPVDPGKYAIQGKANGYRADELTVSLAEAEQKVITLRFVRDASASLAPEPTRETRAVPPPASAEPGGGMRTGPPIGSYFAWVIGAAGIGAGVGMTLHSLSLGNQLDTLCGGDRTDCDPGVANGAQAQGLDQDRRTFEILAAVSYGVGGAAILTGFALWAFRPTPSPSASVPSFEIQPVVGIGRLGVVGRF